MLFALILCAFASEPAVDWTEYDSTAREACREVETKGELGVLLGAQHALLEHAQAVLISRQRDLVELRGRVHRLRVRTRFSNERASLAADAEITSIIRDLRVEEDRLQERIDALRLDARIASRGLTPVDYPRRALRGRCRDSFAQTRADMQRALATLDRGGESLSQIPFHELLTLPPG